jgi:hypothetical protein
MLFQYKITQINVYWSEYIRFACISLRKVIHRCIQNIITLVKGEFKYNIITINN